MKTSFHETEKISCDRLESPPIYKHKCDRFHRLIERKRYPKSVELPTPDKLKVFVMVRAVLLQLEPEKKR